MRKLQAMRSVSKLKCPKGAMSSRSNRSWRGISKIPFFSRVGQDVVGFEPALVATGPEELAREVNKTWRIEHYNGRDELIVVEKTLLQSTS